MNGERQRESILGRLSEARDGLDTNELANLLGLHPNTVRWHLALLADEGLVRSEPRARQGRGRPSIVYRVTSAGATRDRDDYRLLATMLTATVAADRGGEARSYETGVGWGRHLHAAEPDLELAELLDRQGFAAERHGDRVEMRRCPFYSLAETSPEVICTLHRGIIDGALDESGAGERVKRLDPFVEPSLCVALLSRRQISTSTAATTKSNARYASE